MQPEPVSALSPQRIAGWSWPYTVRRVHRSAVATLLQAAAPPGAGDLVLCRVDDIGQHTHLELAAGRRARLFVGDEIVLAYGNRYAPDQFEAEVPDSLAPCQMVAAGGIAATMKSKHARMKAPTRVTPLGLLGDRHGRALNVAQFALPPMTGSYAHEAPVFVVAGTTMNAGKTETATQLIRGLTLAGLRVGAAKVTGTGAGGDTWSMRDAGAAQVLDFVDAGFATTYMADLGAIERVFERLVRQLMRERCEVIVVEVADGLCQRETRHLIGSPVFRRLVGGVLFAAGDAMGSMAGIAALQALGLPVVGAAGVLTSSPLASAEAARAHAVPILSLADLSRPEIAAVLGVAAHRAEPVAA